MSENNLNTGTGTLKVTVNNESVSLKAEKALSITRLLEIQEVESPDMVSVQHNGRILNREEFDSQFVAEGDEINFLYFMGGG